MKNKKTLCWDCQNAYAHKCSWFENFTPVPGWSALPTKIKYAHKVCDSFRVKECPNFVEDEKIEIKTNKEKAKEQGISLRTFQRKYNKSKIKENE